MSNLFNNPNYIPGAEKMALNNKYTAARSNLLLMIIFSAVNLILLATGANLYFMFSATIPYLLTDIALFFCGMYPDYVYAGEFEGMVTADKSLFVVMLIISLAILGIYLLCWFKSKDYKVKWLTIALVLFSFDSLVLLLNSGLSDLVNLLFHVWVIVILAMGIKAHGRLKQIEKEEGFIEGEFTEVVEESAGYVSDEKKSNDSTPIRVADMAVTHRVLLDHTDGEHKIIYRRVGKTNELVIDGQVYADYTAVMEAPHIMSAVIGEKVYSAGNDGGRSFIQVNGTIVKKKVRLF